MNVAERSAASCGAAWRCGARQSGAPFCGVLRI